MSIVEIDPASTTAVVKIHVPVEVLAQKFVITPNESLSARVLRDSSVNIAAIKDQHNTKKNDKETQNHSLVCINCLRKRPTLCLTNSVTLLRKLIFFGLLSSRSV